MPLYQRSRGMTVGYALEFPRSLVAARRSARGSAALSERSSPRVSGGDAARAVPEMRVTCPFPARSTMPVRPRPPSSDVQPLRVGDREAAALNRLDRVSIDGDELALEAAE